MRRRRAAVLAASSVLLVLATGVALLARADRGAGAPRAEPEASRPPALDPEGAPGTARRRMLVRDRIRVVGAGIGGSRPIEGAEVTLEPGPPGAGETLRTLTQADGVATFSPVAPGRWIARAMAPGFLGARTPIEIGEGARPDPLVAFSLEALARIAGTVVDRTGRPIEAAHVHPSLEPGGGASRLHPLDSLEGCRVVTGPEGAFAVRVPPGATIAIEATHTAAGRVGTTVEALVPGETRSLTLTLRLPTDLVGTVVPLARAANSGRLTLCRVVQGRSGIVDERTVVPAPDGRFCFANVSPGEKVLLYASSGAEGVEIGMAEGFAVEERTTDVGEVRVLPSAVDVLSLAAGHPELRRTVEVNGAILPSGRTRGSFPVHARVETGAQSRIAGIPAGRLRLLATLLDEEGREADSAYQEASFGAEFDGSHTEAVFRFVPVPPSGGLEVTLLPPAGIDEEHVSARVALLRDGRVVEAYDLERAGARRFFFRAEPGAGEVVASADGFAAGPAPVEIRAGERTSLTLGEWRPGRGVRGRVLDAAGRPVPGALVRFDAGPASPEEAVHPLARTWTDERGEYRLASLPPLARVFLSAATRSRLSRPVAAEGFGATEAEIDLILDGSY